MPASGDPAGPAGEGSEELDPGFLVGPPAQPGVERILEAGYLAVGRDHDLAPSGPQARHSDSSPAVAAVAAAAVAAAAVAAGSGS